MNISASHWGFTLQAVALLRDETGFITWHLRLLPGKKWCVGMVWAIFHWPSRDPKLNYKLVSFWSDVGPRINKSSIICIISIVNYVVWSFFSISTAFIFIYPKCFWSLQEGLKYSSDVFHFFIFCSFTLILTPTRNKKKIGYFYIII